MPESPNSSSDHVKPDAIGEEDSDEEHANSNYYYSRVANRLSDEDNQLGFDPTRQSCICDCSADEPCSTQEQLSG
jgi:hypothetical protein